MRPYAIFGLVLVLLGVFALMVHSVTFFSTEQEVGPLGFFQWEVTRPHTFIINPIVGLAALGGGIALMFMDRRGARA